MGHWLLQLLLASTKKTGSDRNCFVLSMDVVQGELNFSLKYFPGLSFMS